MVFFTRELFDGSQPNSGRERWASNEWRRRRQTYTRYAEVVLPLVPPAVRRLCRTGLHDGVVLAATGGRGAVTLVVDTTQALGRSRGRQVVLAFRGVRGRPAVARLVGDWWLYEEAHLTPRARFSLQVLFHRSELEVEADELTITMLPRAGGTPDRRLSR